MMKKSISVYVILTLGIGTFLFFSSYTGEASLNQEVAEKKTATTLPQVIQSMKVPGDANLAGEYVPLDNFDAKERLDRELMVNSYWHSSTLHNIKSSRRYFPIIEPILAQHGVPDDFKYLAVAESSLRNARSPAGARGVWQFMEAAGKSYGLVINKEIDQRYDVELATHAACKYLKNAYNRFGNWTLAAASYNMGEGGVSKLLRGQKQTNYYDLQMNSETSRYVSRIIAIKEILKNPTHFGFYLDEEDYYTALNDYSIVEVNTPVASWIDFALKYGTNYRMLKLYNPWLRSDHLTATQGRTYKVKIPK